MDEKRGLYEDHLYSATQFFIQRAKDYEMYYTENPNDWNYGLQNAWAKGFITVTKEDGTTVDVDDRYLFLVGEVIETLANKRDVWLRIGNVSHTFAPRGQNTGVWWKGNSESVTNISIEDAIATNFGLYWWDFLKIMMIAHDSYLNIIPKIISENGIEYLVFDLEFLNKTYNINKTPKSIDLLELSHDPYGFGVNGVEIKGNNFTYTITKKDLSREVVVSDPDIAQSDWTSKYYFAGAIYDSAGTNTWDYNTDVNYFSNTYCLPYYNDLIQKKKLYKGESLWDLPNGTELLRVGDVVGVNGVNIVITRVTNSLAGTAKFEGHEV